ncbi:hypothetical protein Thein_0794 [Thermodesulfatator indicus DSM 15286]|uniref:Uncharacterized protein n=1 Tax=Thermodesulfatator indicus (strain DSM 15286 / JCM 11887 / CIR29812) TaxID=667014 RepID=F8ACH1_THEID|nr:hypothetical protein [Thermodesulfatator indicus]AEH44672.1 hypothetical protein Thein_0794 [Thermodesulfatator indicus DSM 15286]
MKRFLFVLFLCLSPLVVWASKAELSFLKDLAGWKASEPHYLKYAGGEQKAFYIRRFYERGDGARLEVLFAGGTQGEKLAQTLKGRLEVETPDFILKYRQIDGYRALISYAPKEKKGFVAIFLKDNPSLLLLARFSSLSDEEIWPILKQLGWSGLISQGLAFLKEESP